MEPKSGVSPDLTGIYLNSEILFDSNDTLWDPAARVSIYDERAYVYKTQTTKLFAKIVNSLLKSGTFLFYIHFYAGGLGVGGPTRR